MTIGQLTLNKFLFFKVRSIKIKSKEDKKGNYIGIEIIHENFRFFRKTDKFESMYKMTVPMKVHVSEVVCKDSFVSVIVDAKKLDNEKEHYVDIYTYDLNTKIIKCKRSKIELP